MGFSGLDSEKEVGELLVKNIIEVTAGQGVLGKGGH